MRLSRVAEDGGDETVPCPECGGELLTGSVAFPLLGAPKFAYRLKTLDVSVDLTARMCDRCGLVVFRACDPAPIREARSALRRASTPAAQQRTRKDT